MQQTNKKNPQNYPELVASYNTGQETVSRAARGQPG